MEDIVSDKIYVVTGATSGIGLAVAEQLLQMGAAVIGVGRSPERCRVSEHKLRAAYPGAEVRYLVAELSLQSQVRQLGEQIATTLQEMGRTSLDGLVNNAGTYTWWMTYTAEGFETQWAVNHLAPFLLTHELLPLLQAAPAARVVMVSSGSHYTARIDWEDPQMRRSYFGLTAYARTKLANVMFTNELNRRLDHQSRVKAFAADPGLVHTEIAAKGTPFYVRWVWRWRSSSGIEPAESARGIVFLLTEPSIQDVPDVYWKHGKPQQPSALALKRQEAARLWTLSAQMCGLPVEA